MSEISESRIVRCPYNLARGYLAQSAGARAASGAAGSLTLTLSIPGGELVKNVVVTYGSAVDPMHFDEPWHIHWEPRSGPYPVFDGELTVRADETYETSRLELQGTYNPPGGTLGVAFDRVVGKRIAAATAQALLERIGGEMESRYAADEKAKESSPS